MNKQSLLPDCIPSLPIELCTFQWIYPSYIWLNGPINNQCCVYLKGQGQVTKYYSTLRLEFHPCCNPISMFKSSHVTVRLDYLENVWNIILVVGWQGRITNTINNGIVGIRTLHSIIFQPNKWYNTFRWFTRKVSFNKFIGGWLIHYSYGLTLSWMYSTECTHIKEYY